MRRADVCARAARTLPRMSRAVASRARAARGTGAYRRTVTRPAGRRRVAVAALDVSAAVHHLPVRRRIFRRRDQANRRLVRQIPSPVTAVAILTVPEVVVRGVPV